MKKIILIIVCMLSLVSQTIEAKEKLVWPSAPDEARIEYIKSARTPIDFDVKPGFFSKIYKFVVGEDEATITAPFGIYADKERVYISDVNTKCLNVFDKENSEHIVIKGSDNEMFLYPVDVVSDSSGNIYVSDSLRAKIYVFEKDGDYKYTIKLKVFQRPVGVAISRDEKKLYVVDALASQVHIVTLQGELISSIGKKGFGDGEFNRPTFIAVSKDGNIYVSDSMNHRVQILDKNGVYINKFGELGQNIGNFASPRGIALDKDDNVYVNDTLFNNIQIFNKRGELLMLLGHYGVKAGEFALPEDIYITKDSTIYISDTNNKRVQVFKLLDLKGGVK